jgi:hypothetical protein
MKKPFDIETNASDYATGVVLTQCGHPMAYHIDTLSHFTLKYPTYEK